jgi:hypothetical protein
MKARDERQPKGGLQMTLKLRKLTSTEFINDRLYIKICLDAKQTTATPIKFM